jgi:hypothetical protein
MLLIVLFIVIGGSGSYIAGETILANPDASNEVLESPVDVDSKQSITNVKKSKQFRGKNG